MYRNLHARFEAACPVEERNLRARLWQVLNVSLNDQRQCWDMQSDGTYRLRSPQPGVSDDSPEAAGTHQALMNMVVQAQRDADRAESD